MKGEQEKMYNRPWPQRYEGRLKSSWTRLITPSWNFVEVK
jgi:hypothetical protein